MPIPQNNPHETLITAIEELQNLGYIHDFHQEGNHLACKSLSKKYAPENFTITHSYRFEGMSSAGDNSVLYAIEANDGTKGMLVDAYGVYADSLSLEMIEKIRVKYEKPGEE